MAELSLQDQLQPALLDRLSDDEPEKRTESREQRIVSLAKLRDSVLRDLAWLLNAVHLSSTQDLSEYPAVERSVLNFGLPGFAGRTVGEIDPSQIERAVKEALLRYEPRLNANTLKVNLVKQSLRENSHNVVALVIEAELWAQPIPLHMFMKTELDLEIGAVRVTEESEADVEARRAGGRRR
jgi:type VI secretion system protein ImpF